MPMRLLAQLYCARLPMHIVDQRDIEKCELLRGAKLIEADVPPTIHERGREVYCGQAVVMRVTALGQAALKEARANRQSIAASTAARGAETVSRPVD